ncbi:MAG: hypothetical protein ACON4Z_06985 [Planctomycetota bacterium]
MKRSLFVLLVLTAASSPAQSPLTTLFASNNQGAPGGMVYFDLDVQAASGVTVTALDVNLATPTDELEVYVVAGGHGGNEATPSAWSLVARGPVSFAGVDQASAVCLGPGFFLPAGLHGLAVRGDGAVHRYTSSAAPQVYSSAELQLTAGVASNLPFGGAQYAPRVWNGAVYYAVGAGGAGACPWTATFGAGCYTGATSFYESFGSLAAVDLGGSVAAPYVLAATYAGAAGYVVLPGAPQWFAPQGARVLDNAGGPLDDDDVSAPLALPFAMPFPGGVTQTVHATANGEIYFGATAALTSDVTPSASELVTQQPRLAPLWCDLEPNANVASDPASGVYFDVATNGAEAYVTWLGVADGRGGPPPSGATSISVQCVLRSDGSFAFRYGDLLPGPGTGSALVGFGPGGAVPDPGALDLDQSVPFATTGPDRFPLAHAATPPQLGGALTLSVSGAGSAPLAAVAVRDLALPSGVDLAAIGAPGCRAYVDVAGAALVPAPLSAGGGSVTVAVPNVSALLGAAFASQAFAPGVGNALQVTTSNGARWIVGG